MNPRRVHELMNKHFPEFDRAKCDWVLLPQELHSLSQAISEFVGQHIEAERVIVEVSRKTGGEFTVAGASAFMAGHVGESEIKIADREFRRFVVIGQPGVIAAVSPSPATSASCRSV